MSNFLLITSGSVMPETEEEQAAIMKAWGDWFGVLGDHLVDGPNPIGPMVKTIMNDGTLKEGPGGTVVTGYLIINADTYEKALELAMGRPTLDGGDISVYEIMSGM